MRTALVSFIMISGFVFAASAQEDVADDRTPVAVLGLSSVEGDDQVAGTISRTLHVHANQRDDWSVQTEVDVTLAQMILAHGCGDIPDRGCLTRIAAPMQTERQGLILFGRMRRRGEGSDDVRIELVLFDVRLDRATHRAVFDERLSDIIIRGRLDDAVGRWLDRLRHAPQSVFEDTGQPYFEATANSPPGNPNEALEVAGWSLVGVAAASLIGAVTSGGVLLGHNGDARYQAYRSSWDAATVGNVCDAAASDPSPEGRHALGVCNDGSVHEALVPLFWTIAGLSAAAGVLLVWHPWTGSPESPAVGILPVLGPTQGGLSVIGAF